MKPLAGAESLPPSGHDNSWQTSEQVLAEHRTIGGQLREARVNVATFEPKTASAWHVHPTPVDVYVLQETRLRAERDACHARNRKDKP